MRNHPRSSQRCQSITIKRIPNHEKKNGPRDVNEYDIATWRMFDRIVDYRQRRNNIDQLSSYYNMEASSQSMNVSQDSENDISHDDSYIKSIEVYEADPSRLVGGDAKDSYEGEIFELDL